MATVSRLRAGVSFNAFPSRTFSRMGSNHRLHKAKNSNFEALLEVSSSQDMSLFMDDLRSLNFPVFNATRS